MSDADEWTSDQLRVRRVAMPDWVSLGGEQSGADVLGGQTAWHFATPWLFRALASPRTWEPILAAPTERDPFEQRLGYWASLLYVLVFRLGWPDPAGLHLESHGGHLTEPLNRAWTHTPVAHTATDQRRAVLMLDSMVGWYAELAEQGQRLPDIGSRSWHVDVVIRPVGWLGTFRRSHLTGLWFTGSHSVHAAGT